MINAPLWGAYANAKNIGDKQFIKKNLKKSLKITFTVSTILGLILLFYAQIIIQYWTNENIKPTIILLICYFTWTVIESVGNAFAIFLYGCGIVKEQVINLLIITSIVFPYKIYALKNYDIETMILATLGVYLIMTVLMYGFVFKNKLNKIIN